MIPTTDLSFVIQGGIATALRPQLDRTIRRLRQMAPGCRIVVSTAAGANIEHIDADEVVISADAGALPHMKRLKVPNNINRQIQSTRNGLTRVSTPYAVKLRTDCSLRHLGFLQACEPYGLPGSSERIAVCSRFTIDPGMFEQMPFHLSDWFQFGSTAALRDYWSCPFMTLEESQHYLSHRYAPHSSIFDRVFNSKFAVEQHMTVHYAKKLGYLTPAFHNDISAPVMRDFERFMAERTIVLEAAQIGLQFDKYEWAFRSEFQDLNCISHVDWQILHDAHFGRIAVDEASERVRARRLLRKRIARRLFRATQPVGTVLYIRPLRAIINRMLRLLAH